MFRILKFTLACGLFLGLTSFAVGEEPPGSAGGAGPVGVPVAGQAAATVKDADWVAGHRWEFGPFLQGGTGVGTRSDFQFFAAGFQAGRSLTPVLGSGLFRGRFEFAGNVMPLWQAYTPAAHNEVVTVGDVQVKERIAGGTYTGVSVTPVIFRWNFAPRTHRLTPWVQAAGGFIYTTHKFPGTVEVPKGTPGGTSVFNFSPQGGGGFRYFTRPNRSIDFGVNAVHISSASLGDKNPGVNASVQFQLGYSWWK